MNDIKILFMDVDGTMTDGKICIGDKGEIMKSFDVKDGYAIHNILPEVGIIPVVITGRSSVIVSKRCSELNIDYVYQGCIDKKSVMYDVAKRCGCIISNEGIIQGSAYIGDDLPDLSAMGVSQLSACPADAVDEVKSIAHYICKKKGGEGAVREFIEWIIKKD